MINRQMEACKVWKLVEGYDDYNAPIREWADIADIDMAINFQAFNNRTDDIRFADVTHIGLTRCKDLIKGQQVTTVDGKYKVTFVNNRGRLTQIYLAEVVDDV